MHHYPSHMTIEVLEGLSALSQGFLEAGDPRPATTIVDYAYEQE